MGYENDDEFILTPEQAFNFINNDHLDKDENSDDYNTNCASEDKAGYMLMAFFKEHNEVKADNTDPTLVGIEQFKDSLELLLQALYFTSHAQCETLEQAWVWYKATKIKFWLLGLADSYIFAVMYDIKQASIKERLEKCVFQIMQLKTLVTISNVIVVKKGMDNSMLVSYDFPEYINVILLLKEDDDLLLVLNTTCFFMDCSGPIFGAINLSPNYVWLFVTLWEFHTQQYNKDNQTWC